MNLAGTNFHNYSVAFDGSKLRATTVAASYPRTVMYVTRPVLRRATIIVLLSLIGRCDIDMTMYCTLSIDRTIVRLTRL